MFNKLVFESSPGVGTLSESGRAISVGRRVVVTGMAGAGKSTFSRALGAKTGLPVIHLDVHRWRPGWIRIPDDEFREKQRGVVAGEEWIVDGDVTLDLRLERADTVVLLDTPWWICARRAFVRGIRHPAGFQPPDGCDDTAWRRLRDEWWLVWRIWRDRRSERERELANLSRHGKHVALHVLRSKRATHEFLDAWTAPSRQLHIDRASHCPCMHRQNG